ncbi:hypothetical protein [Nonomuraea sp. KM90]|uniref:hypothetical protein n=1 Tax=Nonomuraea sp. KM90 TaxID=3457428 RepID=UPI003FCE5304
MNSSWHQRQHQDFLDRWERDDQLRRHRRRNPSPAPSSGGLLAVVGLIGGGLLVAELAGYSPVEVWGWARTTAGRLINAWLNG